MLAVFATLLEHRLAKPPGEIWGDADLHPAAPHASYVLSCPAGAQGMIVAGTVVVHQHSRSVPLKMVAID